MDLHDLPLRAPAYSMEAEQCVLGALLLDNSAYERVSDLLRWQYFYRDEHRRIYRHIQKIIESDRPADVVTVSEAIELEGETAVTGGIAYLGTMLSLTPSSANIKHYAEIVRERALFRRLIGIGSEIISAAQNPEGKGAGVIIEDAESKLFSLSQANSKLSGGFEALPPVLGRVIETVSSKFETDGSDGITGIASGFHDLDEMTAGFQPGDVIIIAGRPSMGKTAVALNMAEYAGISLRKPAAIFSMEMSTEQLGLRLISSASRVSLQRLRTGKGLSDEDWDRLTVGLSKLHEAPLYIDETGGLTPGDLRARARRLHREVGGLGLIVIDYLQLMASSKDSENRTTEISEISRSIKALAKELKVPIIALSQLSRKVEERQDKRPIMSDLRESGSIEQDADIVIMMYRDEYYHPDTQDKGMAEAILCKHRNGPTGMVRLRFLGEYARFDNWTAPS